jgi:hypothetical protein
MKYYFKIFLLSVTIGAINILIFLFLLQFQIVHNSSYIPQEAFTVFLILVAIPVQFIILILIAFIFKRNQSAITITSGIFIVVWFFLLWCGSEKERYRYSNEQIYHRTEKYDYSQGISTPEGYPIKLLTGRFTISVRGDRNPSTLLETDKVYSENWGIGDVKLSDGGGVVLPDSLQLYWYSFLENKYYELNTKLDKSKISNYFKTGYEFDRSGKLDKITQVSYDQLIVGIAPGGDVVLWISSFPNTKEIGIFKAREINVKNVDSNYIVDEDERKEVLSDTCTCKDDIQFRRIVNNSKPIPFGIWTNKYRKKFNWKIDINNFGQTKSALEFNFFNGEEYDLYNLETTKIKYQKQILPDYLIFTFIKNKKIYKVYLEFDENEIFSHFEKLTQENPDEPIDIVLNINSNLTQATVKSHSKDTTLDFEKMKEVEIKFYAD